MTAVPGAGTGGRAQLAQQPDRLRAAPRARWSASSRETGALVVCDEAYQDFGGPTAIPLLRRTSRLVVLRTFSKAMGMAGLRFGLALAHPAVAAELAKGKLPYNVNLSRWPPPKSRCDHAALLGARTRAIVETRDRFLPRLAAIPGITVFPSCGQLRADPLPGASRGGGVPPAATRSTASWCETSPAPSSWRSACGSRSARRRTWTRCSTGCRGSSAGRRGDASEWRRSVARPRRPISSCGSDLDGRGEAG